MANKVIMITLILFFVSGCYVEKQEQYNNNKYGESVANVLSQLDSNRKLSNEQKIFAKKMFLIVKSYSEDPNNSWRFELMQTEMQKFKWSSWCEDWLLPTKTTYSKDELLYLSALEEIVAIWSMYDINMSDLRQFQKEFLIKMHKLYGTGDIDIQDALSKSGTLTQKQQTLIDIVEARAKRTKWSDWDLVYWHKLRVNPPFFLDMKGEMNP